MISIPLWDQVFGTYYMPKDKRPSVYGVDEHIEPNMVDQIMYPLKGIGNPFNIFRHPLRSIKTGIKFYWNLMKQMKWVVFRQRGMKPPM